MILKPQDILVLLKLVAVGRAEWSYNQLAIDLGMSPSEVHAAIKRALAARLAIQGEKGIFVNAQNLKEFLVHGVKYAFVPESGAMSRGIPTGYAAPPFNKKIVQGNEPPPVWPDPKGEVRGVSFSPLYKSVPMAVSKDKSLYELLVIVDVIRSGKAREQKMAMSALEKKLKHYE